MFQREFSHWPSAVKLLLWLKLHPECRVFDLDNECFATRFYSGRQPTFT